jgi:DNA-directed RNA polymerase subunit RPC12/RpoP
MKMVYDGVSFKLDKFLVTTRSGRVLNKKLFDGFVKDVTLLSARCVRCKKEIHGDEAYPRTDAYKREILEDDSAVVQCRECSFERSEDI